jgi:omega-6 fatty acid desaturase (delta-12 desaturase)
LTRFVYRGFRDPFVFLIIGPLLLFFVFNRLPSRSSQKKQIWNIVAVDIFLIALLVGSYFTVGLWNFVLVMGPVLFLAEDAGIWLFFIQHQFENTYWEHSGQWDPLKSALEGSSFYKLPKVLQWATGNIGFHHIHHLKPRIPNYRLNQCFNEVEELQEVKPIRLLESLKAMSFRLWDEHQRKLIKLSKMNLTNKHGRNLRFSEINNLDFPFREGF